MAEASTKEEKPSPIAAIGLGVIIFAFHIFDLLVLRRNTLVSFTIIGVTFAAYLLFAIMARGLLHDKSRNAFIWFGAMWLVPIVMGLFAKYVQNVPVLGMITIAAAYFPLFIFYFYSRGALTTFLTIYFIAWVAGLAFCYSADLQQYASSQNIKLGFNPMLTYEYLVSWGKNAIMSLFTAAGATWTMTQSEIAKTISAASGDYYSGEVDSAAKMRLGVYIDNLKASERMFYENTPVTIYTTMRAETIDKPLDINVVCEADGQTRVKPRPKEVFNVITSDQSDIDCVWGKGVLKKGTHNIKLSAEFEFTTRSYIKSYIMDMDRLREYRRQNVDPLQGIPDKNPTAIYTSGPVRIGMSLGQQPIPLGNGGEALQSWGVTIENLWDGKIEEITNVIFFVPKGLKITNIEGVSVQEVRCDAVPEEERESCDDNLVSVYALTPEELALPIYKNLVTKSFRIPLEISDPEKVLGKAPVAVQNFKVTAQYRYLIERTISVTVSEVTVSA